MQPVESLIEAAVQAPSGDNTQPWRFAIDPERRRLTIDVDPRRDPSPMNAGQRMARIAIGAALENILQTLERNQKSTEWSVDPATGSVAMTYPAEGVLARDEKIFARVTNRRPYDGRVVDKDIQDQLVHQAAGVPSGVAVHWVFDRTRLPGLAEIIAQADAALFSIREMRLALRGNIRFEAGYREAVSEGLSVASLEMPRLAAPAFRFLTGLSDTWFRRLRGAGNFSKLARQLVGSASGMCIVTAAGDDPATDVLVGLALERAWLALVAQGLCAQPMMTFPVLENVLQQGSPEQQQKLDRTLIENLRSRFRELVPETQSQRPAFLLRFGSAAPVSGRTGRLPWRQLCSWPSGAPQNEREAVRV